MFHIVVMALESVSQWGATDHVQRARRPLASLLKPRCLALFQSVVDGCRRHIFIWLRRFLLSIRRCRAVELRVVAIRDFLEITPRRIKFLSRTAASSRFLLWLRKRCALIVTMPLCEMRRSCNARTPSLYRLGRDEARTSNCSDTAEETLLTFCPSGP